MSPNLEIWQLSNKHTYSIAIIRKAIREKGLEGAIIFPMIAKLIALYFSKAGNEGKF